MDKIRGIVENIIAPVNVGKTRPYVKRTLVLHTWKTDPYSGETTYESWPSFEFSGDKAALLDNLRQGAAVEVQYAVVGKRVTKADGTVAYFNYVRGISVTELRRKRHLRTRCAARSSPYSRWPRSSQAVAASGSTDPYSGETTYESWPSFEFSGDKAALLDNLRQGAAVEVQYAVVGKRVTKADGTVAYFNYVRGISVTELRRNAPQQQPEARSSAAHTWWYVP